MSISTIYTVGGTVQAGRGIYITRAADDELLELCHAGEFAYILTARQMGKSSLIVRTAQRLEAEGRRAVVITLEKLGTPKEPEIWYKGLIAEIDEALELDSDISMWWRQHAHLTMTQRLTRYLYRVVLEQIDAPIMIFVDEIDTTLGLAFTDDFFAVIRSLYNDRATKPEFRRLSFVLVGVATPSELIRDPKRTPFNIGHRVDLDDFTLEEALPLADGLGLARIQAREVLSWVFDWTQGHPYLTQLLCTRLVIRGSVLWSKQDVDQVASEVFLSEKGRKDHNLQFVNDMLTERSPDKENVLRVYDVVHSGRPVADDRQSLIHSHLKLSGVVRCKEEQLIVRNSIYKTVFDSSWISKHLSALDRAAQRLDGFLPDEHGQFFIDGGTLDSSAPYIRRQADGIFFEACQKGELVYILEPRQTGKSSLMVRTARRLRDIGIRVALVDLTVIGTVPPEQWYLAVLTIISNELRLTTNIRIWWKDKEGVPEQQRFFSFFEEVLLAEITEPIVVFIDELDTMLNLQFRGDALSTIRALYNARASQPALRRLSFALLGVSLPSDFAIERARTPFNIGQRVELNDFSLEEMLPLATGFTFPHDQGRQVLYRVHYWTNGHPYLTQCLCLSITQSNYDSWDNDNIDRLVKETFLELEGRNNPNIVFIQDFMRYARQSLDALQTYRGILRNKHVVDDETVSHIALLKLVGLVRSYNGILSVRNRIYANIFNESWTNEEISNRRPDSYLWYVWLLSTLLAVFLAASLALLFTHSNIP